MSIYRKIDFGEPMIREEETQAVLEALRDPILVHGRRVQRFEEEFAAFVNARYAVAVSSCTAAMHLYYIYLGLGPGDEVVMPAQTHVSAAHAVELTGAKPVFVDSEPETGNMDLDCFVDKININTKVISVVHFLGMPMNMKRVKIIAKQYNLKILEDCALALGANFDGHHVGNFGDVGCFSFYPIKHITTAEGGMLITNDENIAFAISKRRAFGKGDGLYYDVQELGCNYRMNEIQAAIGIEQLKKVEGFLKKREDNHYRLRSKLNDVGEIGRFLSTHGEYQSSYYCFPILLGESLIWKRTQIINSLKKRGVGVSIYYPRPVPHMTYYREKYGYEPKGFPEAAKISYSSIALPVGPHLDLKDMDFIAEAVKESIMEAKF